MQNNINLKRTLTLSLISVGASVFTIVKLVPGMVGVNAAAPCIVTLFGQQYDVAPLQNSHTGGNVFTCGTDTTALYQSQHGTDLTRMIPYLITSTPTPTLTPTPTNVPTATPTPTITLTPTPTSISPTPIPDSNQEKDDENEKDDKKGEQDENETEYKDGDRQQQEQKIIDHRQIIQDQRQEKKSWIETFRRTFHLNR